MSYKGKFHPRNPEKYMGDFNKITYRSGLELTVMRCFDLHQDILGWSSEEVIIPYRSPIDGKMHRYFVDFLCKQKLPSGKIITKLIEVKPEKQCSPPKIPKMRTRRFINEVKTWGVNEAKWNAASSACTTRGWEFVILTERDIRNM